MKYPASMENQRPVGFPVDPQFPQRWSPRAMNGEALPRETLMTLFEAARWAPSSGNSQPWRFVYGLRGTPGFDRLLPALNAGNQAWCVKAGALVLVISQNRGERKGQPVPLPNHSFDTGSAWMSLALQGSLLNLVVHGMAGFDATKARDAAKVPEGFDLEAMVAIGFPAPAESLPEAYREREIPSGRNPVSAFAFDGEWPGR